MTYIMVYINGYMFRPLYGHLQDVSIHKSELHFQTSFYGVRDHNLWCYTMNANKPHKMMFANIILVVMYLNGLKMVK
jgi:hypothetical protein